MYQFEGGSMKKIHLIEKRREAKRLRRKGWSIRKIAGYLVCSTNSVRRWIALDDDQVNEDQRGWKKGKFRKYSPVEKKELVDLIEKLENMSEKPVSIKRLKSRYKTEFGKELSDWFVHDTLYKYRNTHEPETEEDQPYGETGSLPVVKKLGRVIMKVDFIKPQSYESGNTPLFFLVFRYLYPCGMGVVTKVSRLSSEELIKVFKQTWSQYVVPDVVIMSNHPSFGAHLTQDECLGNVTLFLLNIGIKPVYSSPEFFPNSHQGGKIEEVFSQSFIQKLYFDQCQSANLAIEKFQLVFRNSSNRESSDFANKNPFFMNVFTELDLKNRRISRFLENKVFFFEKFRETTAVIGQETQVSPTY
jgi:transposase